MDEEKFAEIIKRLDNIENHIKKLEERSGFSNRLGSNILGNMLWEWFEFGSRNDDCLCNFFPPKIQ